MPARATMKPLHPTIPPDRGDGRRQRKLRSLLLDRRFQLKYISMILGVASLLSLVLGTFLYSKIRENSRLLAVDSGLDAIFQEQLAAADGRALAVIAGSLLLFMVVLGLMSLFITHRMAGPLFIMRRHVRALAAGHIPEVRKLRKGDEFVEFYDALAQAVAAIEHRTVNEIGVLAEAVQALEGLDDDGSQEVRRRLQELIQQKRRTLEPPDATSSS